jgi:alkylhydroperoxidase family enzyme
MGDSYCSLVWGGKLAADASDGFATAVIGGDTSALPAADAALVAWARRMAKDPNSTTEADVEDLRRLGFQDQQIFAITLYVALRLAFATVNDTLGAAPDAELLDRVPGAVLGAVGFGRPPAP